MKSSLPIVVVAYNRPRCLQRLLDSILNAHYTSNDIQLIISIDKTEVEEVYAIAEKCDWKYGEKKIIRHEKHLGLKPHILLCGDLTQEYDNIIVLEDDLFVSPYFYDYALQSLAFYKTDDKVAGISLFNYQIAENGFFPFYPAADGYDNYFIQVASSWGQIFLSKSWNAFRNWLKLNDNEKLPKHLPGYLQLWSAFSWKKHLNHFLIEQDQFFVFPRIGLSTNFGEPGVNTDRRGLFQTQLLEGEKQYRFSKLTESKAVYDAWFEITPASLNKLMQKFGTYNYEVDLHGTKELSFIKSDFLLSSKKCSAPLFSFANDMQSGEENIIHNISGSYYSFSSKQNFEQNSTVDIAEHYVALNSIRDIAFHTFINNIETTERKKADDRITAMGAELGGKMKTFADDFYFNQQYPLIQISIIHQGDAAKLEQTLHSIFNQQYPARQLAVKVFSRNTQAPVSPAFEKVEFISVADGNFSQAFVSKINESNAAYFVGLNSGDVFLNNAFEAVNKIFQKYPDINWLTATPTSSLSTQRWNDRIFGLSQKKNSRRFISASSTFWKKHLWETAKPDLKISNKEKFFDDLWGVFFQAQQLYTCDVQISQSANSTASVLLEGNLLSKLAEFFFVNNTPYLRRIYKVNNGLPLLVRFDAKSQSYFLSEY